MKKDDKALKFSNPRMLAAVYFGLLSVVGTILSNALLSMLSVEQLVPLFQAILLGMIIASCTGAAMGKAIIHARRPFKTRTFLIGFFMVLATLPVFDLGLVYLMQGSQKSVFALAKWHDFFFVYMVILGYSYILFGFLLAIASGFAAMYLRAVLVYNVLDTYETKEELKEKRIAHNVTHIKHHATQAKKKVTPAANKDSHVKHKTKAHAKK